MNKTLLKKIIREELQREWGGGPGGTASGTANFEWSDSGLAMIMYLDGKKVMDFQSQKEVEKLISQLQGLLDGPMRTSP